MAQHFSTPQQMRDDVGSWENEGGHLREPHQLEELGTSRTPVETASARRFRHTSLADANAPSAASQVKRRVTSAGSTRTTKLTRVFQRPFRIGKDEEVYAAGPYDILTTEAVHESNERTV